MELKEYSNSLEETLKDSDLQNVSAGLAEVVLDNLINDGIAKDIPIIGSVVRLGKVALGIKERLFLKKISYEDLLRSVSIVNRIMIEDLAWFINREDDYFMFEELGDLINTGLFYYDVENQHDRDLKLPMKYEFCAHISDIGSTMRDILKK